MLISHAGVFYTAISNSPFLTPWMKASHSGLVKDRVGLDAFLVSLISIVLPIRTATQVGIGRNLVTDDVINPSASCGFRTGGINITPSQCLKFLKNTDYYS